MTAFCRSKGVLCCPTRSHWSTRLVMPKTMSVIPGEYNITSMQTEVSMAFDAGVKEARSQVFGLDPRAASCSCPPLRPAWPPAAPTHQRAWLFMVACWALAQPRLLSHALTWITPPEPSLIVCQKPSPALDKWAIPQDSSVLQQYLIPTVSVWWLPTHPSVSPNQIAFSLRTGMVLRVSPAKVSSSGWPRERTRQTLVD